MSPKCKRHPIANVTETQMLPKRKYHQNADLAKPKNPRTCSVTKMLISPKRKCHQKANVTKMQMSPKC